MELNFRTAKLEKLCNDDRALTRKWGPDQGARIRQRLDDLRAAPNLEALRHVKRPHELVGDRAGQISFDLKHPYRLIVQPVHDPLPMRASGGLDWSAVTAICVLEITDTHG